MEEDFIDPKFIRFQSITCFFPSQENGKTRMKQEAILNKIQEELNQYLNKNFDMGLVHSSNQSLGLTASSSVHGLMLYAFEDCIVMM